jgi:hypothetical protein
MQKSSGTPKNTASGSDDTDFFGDDIRSAAETVTSWERVVPDNSRTQVLSEELTVGDERFTWWAVGNGPVLVTVSHRKLGRVAEFTSGDRRDFALKLAKDLLNNK